MRGRSDLIPRAKLRAARETRGWSRPELAARMQRQEDVLRTGEEIRLDPKLVEKWEGGEVRPRLFYQARLCLLLECGAEDLDLEPSARLDLEVGRLGRRRPAVARSGPEQSAPGPRLWTVPHQRNPFFAGRDQVLDHLHVLLAGERGAVAVTQHALCGLGGVGKTQIAVEYAHRYASGYDAVLWVRADTSQTVRADMAAIGRLVAATTPDADEAQLVSAARAWLRDHGRWLLVLDNADDPAILPDLLPRAPRGHVLVTTRAQSLGGLAHAVQIQELSVPAGALLLLRRSGMLPLSASLQDAREQDVLLASQLVHQLGGLPLAIDQAAAFLEETSTALQEYLDAFGRHRRELMERRGGSQLDHPAPAAATLSLSLELLAARDPVAADLLRLCAFLDPDEIPEEILTEGAPSVCPSLRVISGADLRLNQAIASLRRFSLVTRNPARKALTIHRLVQACLQDGMDRDASQAWEERAAGAVRATLPDPSTSYSALGQPARAVQVLRASMHADGSGDDGRAAALWRLAVQQQVLGRLAASERSLLECLDLCRGPELRRDGLKAHQYLALLRAYQGLVGAASDELASGESLVDVGDPPGVRSALNAYRALCALLAGDLDAAAAAVTAALTGRGADVRDAIRASWLQGRVMTAIGTRDRSDRHLAEAGRSLAAALEMCRQLRVVDYEADLLLASAGLSLADGDAAEAERLGREALSIAEDAGFRVLEADIRNLLAEVALRTGRRREVLTNARRALACAECDGAPYCYRPALEAARRHLAAASRTTV
jgi:tetratricopeptide (TPR) repeat protein